MAHPRQAVRVRAVKNKTGLPKQNTPLLEAVHQDVPTVQVAEVCRPLHSVSKICDGAGDVHHEMLFMQDQAVVVPAGTFSKFMEKEKVKIITTYPRRGGLYVQKVKVRDPSAGNGVSFPRPGPSR